MRAGPFALIGLSLAVLVEIGAQERPQSPPTFRSSVDVVPVDVNVLDHGGRPAPNLTTQDFSLSVDGRPRTVSSAQFISTVAAADAPPAPTRYSTNRGAAGRLIVIAVDAGNISPGRGRHAAEAARRFIRTLSPTDRIALVTLPSGSPGIEFTANHDVVEAALARSVAPPTDRASPGRIGIAEALAIERNDTTGLRGLLDRECAVDPSPQGRDACLQQLAQEASALVADTRRRTRASLAALHTIFGRLASIAAPKTIVLISEGFLLEGDASAVAWVGARAAMAHATIYALQVDLADSDAGSGWTATTRAEDRELLREGLDAVASLTRGDVYRMTASAESAFQRLSQEISGYYLLGFDAQPGDRDGKPHRIRIDVRRPDLLVRSRRDFTAPAVAPDKTSTADVLLQTLKSPLPASDIPLSLATYTFRDTRSDRLKVILAVQIDRSKDTRTHTSLAYALIDAKGKVVGSQIESKLNTPIDLRTNQQTYLGSAGVAAAGSYTARVAVADESGRRGSVERPFTAALHVFGAVEATDMLIADNSEPAGATGLMPTVTADFTGSELHTFIELFGRDGASLPDASVRFEIVKEGAASAALTALAQPLRSGDDPAHVVASATIRMDLLPAGDYVARAVIMVRGGSAGTVDRPFSLVERKGSRGGL